MPVIALNESYRKVTHRKTQRNYWNYWNYWNYDASCILTSLLVSDLRNFGCLSSVAQIVEHYLTREKWLEVGNGTKTRDSN
jgi:hypothetical protein